MHTQADLVALMVGVDWMGAPKIVISLVILEVGHCKDAFVAMAPIQRFSSLAVYSLLLK